MRLAICSVLALLAICLLMPAAHATGVGDVTIHFNGGSDSVYAGEDNIMEIWITNDEPLYGISLGFKVTDMTTYFWYWSVYGNKPNASTKYVQEHGDAVDAFWETGGLQLDAMSLPRQFLIGGIAGTVPLPAHPVSTKLYTMKLHVSNGSIAYPNGFIIDNVVVPPAGNWMFLEGVTSYAPTFNHIANLSSDNPTAPPKAFWVGPRAPNNIPVTGYEAASHKLPSATCPAWISAIYNGAPSPFLVEDTLLIITASNAQNSTYVLLDPNVPTGALAMECRMRYVSGSTSTAEAAAMVGFSRGDGWHNFLCISNDQIYLWSSEGFAGPMVSGDTHNLMHTYRIEVDASGTVRVFWDGVLVLNGALIYHSAYTTRIIYFGDGANGAYGESRWTSFKLNTPTVCTCCIGTTGNVNMAGIVDLADLSALVSYLTGGGYVLPCSAEANVNAAGIVDLTDLSALVSYLTGGGYVLPSCP